MVHGPKLAGKSRSVRILAAHLETVRVFAGLDHHLTRAEVVVLGTAPVQRMSRLRQTGLAYLLFPTSEQTRLVHCMGTAYWASRFLDSMRRNSFASDVNDHGACRGNQDRLSHLDGILGPNVSLDLLVRLFSIVHDSDLLPLGHTLSCQLGYFPRPGQAKRFVSYVEGIRNEARQSPELAEIADATERAEAIDCLDRHLEIVQAVAAAKDLLAGMADVHPVLSDAQVAALVPVALFVNDLVTSTVSADLLDFALRDTLGAGIPWNFDSQLLDSLCVFATSPTEETLAVLKEHGVDGGVEHIYRFGMNATRRGIRQHDVVTGVISLLRVRYEVLERVVYHPRKCAADAMIGQAIRNVGTRFASVLTEERLLRMGDDEFVDLLASEERSALEQSSCSPVVPDLRTRRLYREAYRLEDRARLSDLGRDAAAAGADPLRRAEVGQHLHAQLLDLPESEVVFSSRPLTMQAKRPDTLIGWTDGTVLPLADIANEFDYGTEALALTSRYDQLWSLSVYTRAGMPATECERVRSAAARLFER